jgi:hypothetical protein
MAAQIAYDQPDNTARNVVLLLVALAVVWFVVVPMLKSSTAKAIDAVSAAKVACDKAVASKSAADMTTAQNAINEAHAALLTAEADEKAKGLTEPPADLAKAFVDLLNLACHSYVATGGAVVPNKRSVDMSKTWSERERLNHQLCPTGLAVNKVYSAKYTAFDGPECSVSATDPINLILVGKSGEFAFDQGLNAAVGKDPCPGYGKYLTVDYRCS